MLTLLAILNSARTHWRYLLIGAVVGLVALHVRNDRIRIVDAHAAGYASALSRATLVRVDTIDRVVARTDTVIKRVTQRIATVDTLILRVPDSVRVQFPAVDTALKACTALANDCAALRANVLTERTAWAKNDTSLRLTIVAKNDKVRTLEKRWTRKQAIGGGFVAALIAFFGGRQ